MYGKNFSLEVTHESQPMGLGLTKAEQDPDLGLDASERGPTGQGAFIPLQGEIVIVTAPFPARNSLLSPGVDSIADAKRNKKTYQVDMANCTNEHQDDVDRARHRHILSESEKGTFALVWSVTDRGKQRVLVRNIGDMRGDYVDVLFASKTICSKTDLCTKNATVLIEWPKGMDGAGPSSEESTSSLSTFSNFILGSSAARWLLQRPEVHDNDYDAREENTFPRVRLIFQSGKGEVVIRDTDKHNVRFVNDVVE